MTRTLKATDIITIAGKVISDLSWHIEELRLLDARLGDGDLGVTIEVGIKAIKDYLASSGEDDIGKLLMHCGLNFNRASPSTFGTLLASALLEAGKALQGKREIGLDDLVAAGKASVAGVKNRGKAELGDKTMLDSLIPAVKAFEHELSRGVETKEAFSLVVTVAEEGMRATTNMRAKHSRASWRQEDSVGVQDAGATAMYYIIKSITQHLSDYLS